MIKNIIFDIGNVILNFEYKKVVAEYTKDIKEQKFIIDNIINSPEWLGFSLIDTGFITQDEAIQIVQDRTNHTNDRIIQDFWNNYISYAFIDKRVLEVIDKLRNNGYKVYLLSNISERTVNAIKDSNLFNKVDGYVLSYMEHQVKPHIAIYKTLLKRYNLKEDECLFVDDNKNNIKTANELGIIGRQSIPDDYDSVIKILKEEINFDNN